MNGFRRHFRLAPRLYLDEAKNTGRRKRHQIDLARMIPYPNAKNPIEFKGEKRRRPAFGASPPFLGRPLSGRLLSER
jgi:hypothetical protein